MQTFSFCINYLAYYIKWLYNAFQGLFIDCSLESWVSELLTKETKAWKSRIVLPSLPLKIITFFFLFVPTKMIYYREWKYFSNIFILPLLLYYSLHFTHKIKVYKFSYGQKNGSSSLRQREYYILFITPSVPRKMTHSLDGTRFYAVLFCVLSGGSEVREMK